MEERPLGDSQDEMVAAFALQGDVEVVEAPSDDVVALLWDSEGSTLQPGQVSVGGTCWEEWPGVGVGRALSLEVGVCSSWPPCGADREPEVQVNKSSCNNDNTHVYIQVRTHVRRRKEFHI